MISWSKKIHTVNLAYKNWKFPMGTLYYGDNLEVLRKHIKTESVDLIYLDPPFNSQASYNVIFKTKSGKDSPSQIQAFDDTWKWNTESEMAYSQILGIGDRISDVVRGLHEAIGNNDMMAYITMMSIRLIQLHQVLKPTGSLYLHCDPTASHYLKVILDAIFGTENFRNEIIWHYGQRTMHNKYKFNAKHDVILFYAKSKKHIINQITTEWTKEQISKTRLRKILKDEDGREYILDNRSVSKGYPVKKQYIDDIIKKGKAIDSVWNIPMIVSTSPERLGYPTQKPLTLLKRIIEASSKKGDVVLDPFCGCGTAIHAAQELEREWIGIDVTHLAIGLIEYRMKETFGIKPIVKGVPTSFESAENLAERDKFQFEAWAVTRIDGIMPNQKKGRDRGIDGRGYIPIGNDVRGNPKYAKVIVSVKGGQRLTPSMVRDLKGTVTRENAELGIFICLKEPTSEMTKEASTGGIFETPLGTKHPKIQIYTIKDYFNGKHPDLPQISRMFKVPRLETKESKSQQLTLE